MEQEIFFASSDTAADMAFILINFEDMSDLFTEGFIYTTKTFGDILMDSRFRDTEHTCGGTDGSTCFDDIVGDIQNTSFDIEIQSDTS